MRRPSWLAASVLLAAPSLGWSQAAPATPEPTPTQSAEASPTPAAPAATNAPAGEPTPSAPATPGAVSAPSQGAASNGGPSAIPAWVRALVDGFSFGSYGRVVLATDLRGRWARPQNIVAHGTRLDESTYAELELHRDDVFFQRVRTRMVATLAINGPLFHQTGDFAINMAVRNLYLEERGVGSQNLALWVGSRMYRGDDAYLLNWWPLDNLNTVGAGGRYDAGEHFTVQAHFGMNRLDSSYQFQQIRIVPRSGVGSVGFAILDRPRFIGSVRATWWLNGRRAPAGVKLVAYAEGHGLPDGVRQDTDSGRFQYLPSDGGFVAGAQLGLYTGQRNTYVNLWFRYAHGLASYGDLAAPFSTTARPVTWDTARDVVLALAGNFEVGAFGLMGAAYVRYYRDADPTIYNRSAQWEGTISLRPTVWLGNYVGIAGELNYQAVRYNALDPTTGRAGGGNLYRFALIPYVTPAGRGNFTRPHLRAIYSIAYRDEGARGLYPPDDPYSSNAVEHYLGFSTEWWFNSSYL